MVTIIEFLIIVWAIVWIRRMAAYEYRKENIKAIKLLPVEITHEDKDVLIMTRKIPFWREWIKY